jgi:hypothetical protein
MRADTQTVEYERSLLASYTLGADISPRVNKDTFISPAHKAVFQVIQDLRAKGITEVKLVMLVSELEKRGRLDESGGPGYIAEVCSALPTVVNASYYQTEVLAAHRARTAKAALLRAQDELQRGADPDAVFARMTEAYTPAASAENFPIVRMGCGAVTPPEWIVKGLLTADSFCCVYGAAGSGKSFLALDLAASVATGRSFHGAQVKRPGGVLYIAGEGQGGLNARLAAWRKHTGRSLDDAPLYLNARSANLIADPEAAERDITAAARSIPELRLIIVDTWSRCLGGDDSAPSDAARGVQVLDNIRRNLPGVAVLIITHSGHSARDRARGWSGVYAAADTSYRVEAVEDALVLTCDKCKDGALPPPAAYRKEIVGLGVFDEDDAELTSLAIGERVDIPVSCIPGGKVNAADLLVAEYERLSESGEPVKKADLKSVCILAGVGNSTYKRAQREALAAGRLMECGERKKGHLDSLTAPNNDSQNDANDSMTLTMTDTGQANNECHPPYIYKAVTDTHLLAPDSHSGPHENRIIEPPGRDIRPNPPDNRPPPETERPVEEYELW